MKITIDILLVLKFYLLGSLISLIILFTHKYFIITKRNIIIAVLISWLNTLIILEDIRKWILDILYNRIELYNYCVVESILYFDINERDILKSYFMYKWKQKKHHYANKLMSRYEYCYRSKDGNCWDSAYDYTEYRFISRYKGGKY